MSKVQDNTLLDFSPLDGLIAYKNGIGDKEGT